MRVVIDKLLKFFKPFLKKRFIEKTDKPFDVFAKTVFISCKNKLLKDIFQVIELLESMFLVLKQSKGWLKTKKLDASNIILENNIPPKFFIL